MESNLNNNLTLIKKKLVSWYYSIPLTVRIIIITSFILSTINLFSENTIYNLLNNNPKHSLHQFQVWRFITGSLISRSIFSLLFSYIAYINDGITLEKSLGSIHYFLYFLLHSTIIQITCSLITIISNCLWGFIMFEVTALCFENPNNEIQIFCFPKKIKAKYYPAICLVIFFLFAGPSLDIFVGIFYGVIYGCFLKKFVKVPKSLILKLEEGPFKCLKENIYFIRDADAKGFEPEQTIVDDGAKIKNSSRKIIQSKGNFRELKEEIKDDAKTIQSSRNEGRLNQSKEQMEEVRSVEEGPSQPVENV